MYIAKQIVSRAKVHCTAHRSTAGLMWFPRRVLATGKMGSVAFCLPTTICKILQDDFAVNDIIAVYTPTLSTWGLYVNALYFDITEKTGANQCTF